jgi:hypothetical protein
MKMVFPVTRKRRRHDILSVWGRVRVVTLRHFHSLASSGFSSGVRARDIQKPHGLRCSAEMRRLEATQGIFVARKKRTGYIRGKKEENKRG